MVVVFPEPFTPTTRITKGFRCSSITSGFAQGARISAIAPRSATISASTSASSLRATRFCRPGEDVLGRLDTDIGAQQPGLELLQRLRVDFSAPGNSSARS